MNIAVVPGGSLAPEHIDAWSKIQAMDTALSSPLLSPGFTLAVAAVRRDVHVGILEEGGEPVGFFPYRRGWCSTGHPVGGLLNDLQAAIVRPGVNWDALQLIRACGLRTWTFSRVLASQQEWAPFHLRHDVSGVIDVSQGYDAYAEEKRPLLRSYEFSRRLRKLERDVGPVRFELHDSDPAQLATLMEWKRKRYAKRGYADVFAIPWARRVLEHIQATQTTSFAGLLSVLHAGDELVAAHMGMRSQSTWQYWVPSYNPKFARHSPGLILLLMMAECAPGMGLQRIDLGGGEYRYKRLLANRSFRVAGGAVDRLRAMSAARRWCRSNGDWIRASPLLRPPARSVLRTLRRLKQYLPA